MFSNLQNHKKSGEIVQSQAPKNGQKTELAEKWEIQSIQEKLKTLEKIAENVRQEVQVLKTEFENNRSKRHIQCRYYDHLLYQEILIKQIDYKKSQLIFGVQQLATKNILDLDFTPMIIMKNYAEIKDDNSKAQNILSILSLNSDFCILEIRLFIYQILGTVRKHLKQFTKEQSTQTEIVISLTKPQTTSQSINLINYPHKLENLEEMPVSIKQKFILKYYFMGVIHYFEIYDLEMNIYEFMQEIFGTKAEFYELILIKNINLQQVRFENETFLMELFQMQKAYNIYVMVKFSANNINNKSISHDKNINQITENKCKQSQTNLDKQEDISDILEDNQEGDKSTQLKQMKNKLITLDFSEFEEEEMKQEVSKPEIPTNTESVEIQTQTDKIIISDKQLSDSPEKIGLPEIQKSEEVDDFNDTNQKKLNEDEDTLDENQLESKEQNKSQEQEEIEIPQQNETDAIIKNDINEQQ